MDTRRAIIHFLDGTGLTLEWPRQAPEELPPGVVRNARKVGAAEAARGVISLKNSRIEPLNHERSAEHRLGSSGKDSKRAETVLGAPVHGEGGGA